MTPVHRLLPIVGRFLSRCVDVFLQTIKNKVTGVIDTASEIAQESEEIRNDINASLSTIEEMLHVAKKQLSGMMQGPFAKTSSNSRPEVLLTLDCEYSNG